MNTTVYFMRHSESMQTKTLNYNEPLQLQNEKFVLSIEGERRAKILSEVEELSNIDLVISSHYVRAIATAKYIADKNNLDVLVDSRFGERKMGIKSWDELPKDFGMKQFLDEDYKIGDGESRKEVASRMSKALMDVLNKNCGKKLAIVSHGTALAFLFKTWGEVEPIKDSNKIKMTFKDKVFFEEKFITPTLFKLVFNEKNELMTIENIKITY